MNTTLEPRKFSLLLRLACLILLTGFTPFEVAGIHKEGEDYGIFFFVGILIILLPELYIKLFLKPVSAVLMETEIVVKHYHGTIKQIKLNEIKGYSATEEQTNYGMKRGVLLYLKNGKHVDFTEINIKDIAPLANYLNINNVLNYGSEKLRPWFSSKYKYNRY
jgi:hypothetical protein